MLRSKRNVLVYVLLVLFTAFPWLCVIMAGSVANACGCALDEGSAHPCIVAGMDVGGVLYALGMMGWLGILTTPLGIIGLGGFTFYLFLRSPDLKS
jgi:hypothetical protein